MEGNAPNGNQGQHDGKEISLDEKVQQLLKMKKSVHDLVVQNSDKAQDRQKRNYDKKHDSSKVGNLLYLHV